MRKIKFTRTTMKIILRILATILYAENITDNSTVKHKIMVFAILLIHQFALYRIESILQPSITKIFDRPNSKKTQSLMASLFMRKRMENNPQSAKLRPIIQSLIGHLIYQLLSHMILVHITLPIINCLTIY